MFVFGFVLVLVKFFFGGVCLLWFLFVGFFWFGFFRKWKLCHSVGGEGVMQSDARKGSLLLLP